MISLIQWTGSNVTPSDDAALYAHFDGNSGIISGCVPASTGGNQITITSGRGYICGRQFVVQQETINAQVSTTGAEMQGRLLVQVDISNTEQPITWLTQVAASLPDLVQDDLNDGGNVYQLPLATYTIDSVAISDFSVVDQTLDSLSDELLRIGGNFTRLGEIQAFEKPGHSAGLTYDSTYSLLVDGSTPIICIDGSQFGVMRRSQFGYLTEANLQNIRAGIYWVNGYNSGITGSPPFTNVHYMLLSTGTLTNCLQVAISNASGHPIKMRHLAGGSWTDWA